MQPNSEPAILIAPTSFKGSLSPHEAANAIHDGVRQRLPRAKCRLVPLADGGEGTLRVFLGIDADVMRCNVTGPMGKETTAEWGFLPGERTAILEAAQAIGLPGVPKMQRNPWQASSRGVGEMILEAIAQGAKKLKIGLGGVASVDGGVGLWQALGARVEDAHGDPVSPGAAGMCRVHRVDLRPALETLGDCALEILVDVDAPLLGESGARLFMAQKGASESDEHQLDAGLARLAKIMEENPDALDVASAKGAGAAGGMGAAFAWLGAKLRSGSEAIADQVDLQTHVQWSQLVITGEGAIDEQTHSGKALLTLSKIAKSSHRPVIALTAMGGPRTTPLPIQGISSIVSICSGPSRKALMMRDAADLVRRASFEIAGIAPFLAAEAGNNPAEKPFLQGAS